jgi:putative ABC transport system substrate-binding protein
MKLREVVLTAMLAALMAASPCKFSYAADQTYRVGILTPSVGVIDKMRVTFFPELAKLGFAEGKNLTIDVAAGDNAQLPSLARRLALNRPNVVIGVGAEAIRAMREAASGTPIVGSFIGEDPIAAGFAASLAHPGGTVTGIVMLAPELDAKRLLLLHEMIPDSRRIAALAVNPARDAPAIAAMNEAAERVGIKVLPFYAARPEDYRATFAAMRNAGADSLEIISAPELFSDAATLAELAKSSRLPTICEWRSMASQGCLVGYGPDYAELHRRVADFVARLLRGEAPGDLPIEGPTHFEFAINQKTATALGVKIPTSMLLRADEVIE